MNESAEHAFSLIELHGRLNSSHFLVSFGTIENPTLVSAISPLSESSDAATAMATLSTCRNSSMARKDSWTGVRPLVCVRHGLLGNAGVDHTDLDVNEAGMRPSLRITSWSEAGERLRSRVTRWSGKTCTAGTDSALRRVCPEDSVGWYGCFCAAPSVQHRKRTNGTLVDISVERIRPRPRLLLSGNS